MPGDCINVQTSKPNISSQKYNFQSMKIIVNNTLATSATKTRKLEHQARFIRLNKETVLTPSMDKIVVTIERKCIIQNFRIFTDKLDKHCGCCNIT